jgi:hypothetical protein
MENVRFFPPEIWNEGGFAPLGGDYAAFSTTLVLIEGTLTSDGRSVEGIITHEMDHLRQRITAQTDSVGHLRKPDGTTDFFNTLNSKQCN